MRCARWDICAGLPMTPPSLTLARLQAGSQTSGAMGHTSRDDAARTSSSARRTVTGHQRHCGESPGAVALRHAGPGSTVAEAAEVLACGPVPHAKQRHQHVQTARSRKGATGRVGPQGGAAAGRAYWAPVDRPGPDAGLAPRSPDYLARCGGHAEGRARTNGRAASFGGGCAQVAPAPARSVRVLPRGRQAAYRRADEAPATSGAPVGGHHPRAGANRLARPAAYLREPSCDEGGPAEGGSGADGARDHPDDGALRPPEPRDPQAGCRGARRASCAGTRHRRNTAGRCCQPAVITA